MQETAPLPPNVSPVTAGRLGLWLLHLRAHRAASRRIAFPYRNDGGRLVRRFAALICPWDVYEYPGAARFLAALIGCKQSSAKRYLMRSRDIPLKHAPKLAEYLEGHASECEALARELRVYAGTERLRTRKKGLAKRV